MTTQRWPTDYLRPSKITRHIAPRTTAGTVSTAGFTQRVSVPIHSWQITYGDILIGLAYQVQVWDAWEAYLDGGATPVLVPLFGDAFAALPDGTAVAGAAYPVGATNMSIYRPGAAVLGGYHFSVGERLYRTAIVTPLGSNQYNASFRPPLRDPVSDATLISFSDPVCKCRLASDDEISLQLTPGNLATATVRFVEDPNAD